MNKGHVDFEDSLLEASMRIIVQPLVDECDKFISECENDDIEIPEKLKKQVHNALIKEKYHKIQKVIVIISKRIAVAIMILSTLLTVACASIKPLRENVFNAIITWYEDYFTFAFDESSDEFSIVTDMTFTYLPEGYTITSDVSAGGYREVLIENGDNLITYLRRPYSYENDYMDSHLTEIEEIEINDRTVVYFTDAKGSSNVFTWIENGYWYMLASDINREELIKIIENINNSSISNELPEPNNAHSYDINNDGILQTEEFPLPTGEMFGLSGEYANVYTLISDYFVSELIDISSKYPPCEYLFLPSIRVATKYEDENQNINYVVNVLICVYYDIGENYNYFPTPIYYDSGGMGNLCRIILTPEGELVSIEKTPPASDSSWYYKFCGPHVEIAETLLGLNDNEISYHFEMTRDFSELISDYLTFYFS